MAYPYGDKMYHHCNEITSEEFDKYVVADIIKEEARKKGITFALVNIVSGRRCPLIELNKGVHKVRISVHDSGKRKYDSVCWVGVGFSDLKKLEELPNGFIVVVEKQRYDYIIVPLLLLKPYLRSFRGGQSFKLWIKAESYRLGHKREHKVAHNDLQQIFDAIENCKCLLHT